MSRFDDKTVLITGASAGLGAALAQAFAHEGASLVLLARRLERLEVLATSLRMQGCVVQVFRCDVAQPSEWEAVLAELARTATCVDVAVANVGFGVVGNIQQLDIEDYRRQFETNVFGVLQTFYALQGKWLSSKGSLVVIGSIAGYVAQPGGSAYVMSKFALRALCDSIRADLAKTGISVTLITAGLLETDFRRVDNQNYFHADKNDPFPQWLSLSAESAARQIVLATPQAGRANHYRAWQSHCVVATTLSVADPVPVQVWRRGAPAGIED
ncbi:MAG: SDR family NAD(P)-dependent oxidoreductase [Steroidobacteraceae bacterium]